MAPIPFLFRNRPRVGNVRTRNTTTPHTAQNHPAGTAGHAIGQFAHNPLTHRPTVPRSLRGK